MQVMPASGGGAVGERRPSQVQRSGSAMSELHLASASGSFVDSNSVSRALVGGGFNAGPKVMSTRRQSVELARVMRRKFLDPSATFKMTRLLDLEDAEIQAAYMNKRVSPVLERRVVLHLSASSAIVCAYMVARAWSMLAKGEGLMRVNHINLGVYGVTAAVHASLLAASVALRPSLTRFRFFVAYLLSVPTAVFAEARRGVFRVDGRRVVRHPRRGPSEEADEHCSVTTDTGSTSTAARAPSR